MEIPPPQPHAAPLVPVHGPAAPPTIPLSSQNPNPNPNPSPNLPSALHLQSTLEALGQALSPPAAEAEGASFLPAPQQFDFIPPLHALVAKVHSDELDPKDLSHQANPIRVKVAKARQLVAELPDVSRDIAAQQDEIRALEHRLRMQRRVIADALTIVRAQLLCRGMPTTDAGADAHAHADSGTGMAGKGWDGSMTAEMHLDH